jgi:serine/threonine protein kinase
VAADLIGESLGQFRIVAKLGQGGMGVVYKATDEKLRRTVALKVLPPGFASDPARRDRFLREARAAAALNHVNIATVHDVGEASRWSSSKERASVHGSRAARCRSPMR